MGRCGVFSEAISAEILEAFETTMVFYRLKCEREDSAAKICITKTNYRSADKPQKLADALNRRFRYRRYYVEKIDNYKLPDFKNYGARK